MVGMAVGGDHAHDRLILQRPGQHLLPGGAGGVGGHAAIDHAPALAAFALVPQHPQIDVVEGERPRHAQPADAGRHLAHRTRGRQFVGKGIGQLGFKRIHVQQSFVFHAGRARYNG